MFEFTILESTKSIKRYLPPNGMEATVLLVVSSPIGVSYILEKIIPDIFIAIHPLYSVMSSPSLMSEPFLITQIFASAEFSGSWPTRAFSLTVHFSPIIE